MNRIHIQTAADPTAVGKIAAEIFLSHVRAKPNAVLGLATGSTPLPLYAALVNAFRAGSVSFKAVRTVNLDEYVGLAPTHDQSYRYFMNENLFKRIDIDLANTYIPDGTAEDPEAACKAYEEKIAALGGIDIQLLGIGLNGHIGFNEPDDVFSKTTHVVRLTAMTRESNQRFFASLADVPTHAVTMGIGTIFAAKKLVLVVTGANKAEILKKTLYGEVDPRVPASILQFHPNVEVFADEAAARLL